MNENPGKDFHASVDSWHHKKVFTEGTILHYKPMRPVMNKSSFILVPRFTLRLHFHFLHLQRVQGSLSAYRINTELVLDQMRTQRKHTLNHTNPHEMCAKHLNHMRNVISSLYRWLSKLSFISPHALVAHSASSADKINSIISVNLRLTACKSTPDSQPSICVNLVHSNSQSVNHANIPVYLVQGSVVTIAPSI